MTARIVRLDPRDIPGGMRGRAFWYDPNASSAVGELSSYEHATIFRFAPDRPVRAHGAVLVNVHATRDFVGVLPVVELDARRAPWTGDGGVYMAEHEGRLAQRARVGVSVESDAGIVYESPGVFYAWDREPLALREGGELALRARFTKGEDRKGSLFLVAVLVIDNPGN